MKALEARGLDPGQLAWIRNYLELRLEAFKRMIRQHVERELGAGRTDQGTGSRRRGPRREAAVRADARRDRPDEERVVRAPGAARSRTRSRCASARSTERLTRGARRRKSASSTAGCRWRSSSSGAHARSRSSSRICDVSDSGPRTPRRFMLQLVWSLQECFSRGPAVPCSCRRSPRSHAAPFQHVSGRARRSSGPCKGTGGRTTAGPISALRVQPVREDELESSLDRKTTILMLGDAQQLQSDPQAWALRLIRERVKGIIWLNPEGQWGRGIGDSVIAQPAATSFECRRSHSVGETVDSPCITGWRRGSQLRRSASIGRSIKSATGEFPAAHA